MQEDVDKARKVDPGSGKMTLRELLRLYDDSLTQFAPKTIGTRRSIAKAFKETWPHGLEIAVGTVSPGHLTL